MALLDSELARLKHELGFNLLQVGAEPYIGVTRYFEQIVVPNLSAGALTTSSTTVAVASAPTPVTLTLASATGFAMLARVVVDVDDLQETATVQNVSGNTITLPLKRAHTGTYPVAVEGGETLVREYLARCRKVATLIEQFGIRAGVKRVDKIEFFGGAHEMTGVNTLGDLQMRFRRELCQMLFGVGNIQQFGGAGSRMSVY